MKARPSPTKRQRWNIVVFHPALVEGRADNIKVTRPEDLALAEFYLTRTIHQEKA
ncbi:2-C-methyl-D-erythritol 4-phosphate cytidylyltransferase [Salmonella enterica subsp. enterica]|uniref:2-C-methyl-D-erythritol 4-phosphate cytidylyltransferase n=1 Tax=Salmonella enterica I TaxID=59201 RepID=A0A447TWG7_SALET|nr:2-C-methyl-D-erythritol 4-phosphate cytidylyltransferase [Salmonella enterica subsp. enterica]